ncbi:hypothetical protein FRB91_008330 [Serendipita sp. 411]|nr:hypothetical protein FRB91_008330 [Serendipita sp. 411]
MSDEFSDDLSDPTPSPPPARSSSKAHNNTRKGAATLAAGRGKTNASNKPPVPVHRKSNSAVSGSGLGHSRTHSQANSVTMSIQSGSHAKIATISKRHSPSQSNSAGSQSGSDLSSPPSEEEKEPTRPDDGDEDEEEDEDEDEEEDEDENGDGDKNAVMPITAGRAGRVAMSQRSTRRSSSTRGRGTRSSRGVIPAPMWEWAKKKNYKKPKASQSGDDDEDDEMENVGDVLGQSVTDSSILTDKPLHLSSKANSQDLEDVEDDVQDEETIEKNFTDHGAGKTEIIKHVTEDGLDNRQSQEPNDDDDDEEEEDAENGDLEMTVPSVKVEPPPSTVFSPKALPSTLLDIGDLDYQREDELMNAEDDIEGDIDLELHAADRQDALDALALLELKLAMIRQRLFQDKMDELGREEDMIRNGTHPELLHTISELDKRRERRIHLAENKRKRDLELASKLRSHDEDGIWSWWGIQKDMLQSTMITEASRKRRKIERDRRALLDPIRRTLESFPPEPPKAVKSQHLIPSLKEVVSVALRHPYARLPHSFINERPSTHSIPNGSNKGPVTQSTNPRTSQGQTTPLMPTMSQLTEVEVQDDLEILLEYRRPFEDIDVASHGGHHPTFVPPGGAGFDAPPPSGPHGRVISEHSRNTYETGRRDVQSFPDHVNPQNRGVSSANATFGGGTTNGRDRPLDQEKIQTSNRNYPHSHGHGHSSLSGPSYPSHPRSSSQVPNQSPGLGFQVLHRAPEMSSTSLPIQNMPLPPAPSTLPQSNANKSIQGGPGVATGHSGSTTHSQHSSFSWEPGRKEREREHEGHGGRDRHNVTSWKNSVAPNSSYVPASAGSTSSHGGRSHSHSVSHHFHPAHSHNQSQHMSSRPHTHTVQVHHHSQPHPHHPTSSHLHVIHNHAPMAPPTELSKSNAPYRHETSIRPGYQAEKGNRTETTTSAWKGSGYEEGDSNRPRSSYSNGPDKDNDRDFHRNMPPSSASLLPPLTHPHERSATTSTFHHPSHNVFSRDSWSEREHEDRERYQGREKELQRGHPSSATTYATVPSSDRYSTSTQQSTNQAIHPNLSRYQHQGPSRTGSSIGYSPPLSASSISRRASPPPLLPPVPNTSHRYTSTAAGSRHSPTAASSEPSDILPSTVPFHTQPGTPDLHSSSNPLNLSGFNPWSAPPRATARPSTAGSPTLLPGQTQSTKATSSMISSTAANSLSPHRTSTSPVLPRPQPSISPAPRPSLSPAPRPPSSSSIHSILQPPLRETAQSSHGSSSNTFPPSKRLSNDSASMEVDPIQPTVSTHFGLNPSSK